MEVIFQLLARVKTQAQTVQVTALELEIIYTMMTASPKGTINCWK
jgi:hypothetical protein